MMASGGHHVPMTATIPGWGSSHGIEPGMSTHALPAASTTISLKG
jgi:hypothetical protein